MAKKAYKPVKEKKPQKEITINVGSLSACIKFEVEFTDEQAAEIKAAVTNELNRVIRDLR